MAACAVLLLSAFAAADTSVALPDYLRALADLRYARAHLSVETSDLAVDADDQQAIDEIDMAIREVKEAAMDDGKSLDDHPPVDTRAGRSDRLYRALELLDKAHEATVEREQVGYRQGLKADSAQHHIDKARKAVHHAIDAERHE